MRVSGSSPLSRHASPSQMRFTSPPRWQCEVTVLGKAATIPVADAAFLIFCSCVLPTRAVTADGQVCGVNADLAFGHEDYATMIVLHRRLVQAQPDNALAHYHLGFPYGMVGRASD
jgi:hypothetical protein